MTGVTLTVDRVGEVIQSIHRLVGQRVMVGVLHDERPGGGIGNAALGYIHEHGAPEVGIPPRPHLVPGIRSVQYSWMGHLRWAGAEALAGRKPDAQLEKAGQVAVEGIRAYIEAGVPPPLQQSTLTKRKRAGRGRAIPVVQTVPLIATHEYIQSIDFKVVK